MVNVTSYVLAILLPLLPIRLMAAMMSGWVGTYTFLDGAPTGSTGIYGIKWNAESGSLTGVYAAASLVNPTFLLQSANGRTLYATSEDDAPTDSDTITVYSVDMRSAQAALHRIGLVSSRGKGPCHLSMDPSGRWLFVANYRSGSIAIYPVLSDGALGEARQTIQHAGMNPHAHEVVPSPDGRHLLAVDLGVDKIFSYRFDGAIGSLSADDHATAALPRGSGPRHLVFSKDGRFVYVITEHTAELFTFRWDAQRGALTLASTMPTLPDGYAGRRSGAELALTADGRYLYASNRGDSNSITTYRLDSDGLPVLVRSIDSGGRTPRFINVDASGRFLIVTNQGSNQVLTFRIDPQTGDLRRLAASATVPAPVHLVIAPSGEAH